MRWITDRVDGALEFLVVRVLDLGKIAYGIVATFSRLILIAIPTAFVASRISPPSAELLGRAAEIGVVLVLAYVLEAVWLVSRFVDQDDYEQRLGIATGFGLIGMSGVVVALLLSAHRAAGHDNWLDHAGVGWVVPSLTILAVLVVIQPLLVHEWEQPERARDQNP